ncbi:MAG: radical SAM family heme chaperone HemW [Lachnospiraceae bacterium]|nr:radical SAM family heme chaperone HemW [Lachnospiraceae bacterium]
MRELSIYLHIPFCVRKCLYCDFLSFPVGAGADGKRIESYVNLLKEEIIKEAPKYRAHQVISVFWGGGTPSLVAAKAVSEIMETLWRYYRLAADAEITIEVNPGTVTADKLQTYITAGMNRLSIGLQSADDGELARIGRIHDYRTFLETYRLAREAGFRNINIDLMAALPEQSVDSYRETLRRAAALMPEHISAYSLILEEGTPLYEKRQACRFPTEEEDREMYLLTDAYLSACGYHRYEISNYAREGYECRHNKVYWQRGDYAGFGLGAASMVQNVRWQNPAEPERYERYVRYGIPASDTGADEAAGTVQMQEGDVLAGQIREEHVLAGQIREEHVLAGQIQEEHVLTVQMRERHVLTVQEQMEEFMFLGLRMICGVSRERFAAQFGRQMEEVYGAVLERMYKQALLVREEDRIRLTERGLDVSNYVMAEFLF